MYNAMYHKIGIPDAKVKSMTQMIRKQIYIASKHQALLSQLSKARGVSEAEVIRQALEREAVSVQAHFIEPDATALNEIVEFAHSRRALGVTGQPLQWKRDDAYSERLDCYQR